MGKIAAAAVALREVAEVWRGFALVAEVAERAGGIERLAARVAAEESRLSDVLGRYHAVLAEIKRDRHTAVRRAFP